MCGYLGWSEYCSICVLFIIVKLDILTSRWQIVIQALKQGDKNVQIKDLDNLTEALSPASTIFSEAVIQWMPVHSNVQGNEETDRLVKRGKKNIADRQKHNIRRNNEQTKKAIYEQKQQPKAKVVYEYWKLSRRDREQGNASWGVTYIKLKIGPKRPVCLQQRATDTATHPTRVTSFITHSGKRPGQTPAPYRASCTALLKTRDELQRSWERSVSMSEWTTTRRSTQRRKQENESSESER